MYIFFCQKYLTYGIWVIIFYAEEEKIMKVYVNGYYRKDGTYIKGHYRNNHIPGAFGPKNTSWAGVFFLLGLALCFSGLTAIIGIPIAVVSGIIGIVNS